MTNLYADDKIMKKITVSDSSICQIFGEKDITVMNCEKTLMARIIRAGIVTIYDFTEPFS